MKIRNGCSFSSHLFFNQHGFVYINSPIITSTTATSCKPLFNVTTLFNDKTVLFFYYFYFKQKGIKYTKDGKIDYSEDFFKREVILCESNELSIEPFCLSLGDVYSFNPVFTTNTEKNELSEKWSLTVEMSFIELGDLMDICEDYIKHCFCYIIEKNNKELKYAIYKEEEIELKINELNRIVLNPFKRIDYKEIKDEEKEENGVFVFHKPIDKSKFYIKTEDDGSFSYSFDIVLPEIGIIGEGYMKEDRIGVVEERMKENGYNDNAMKWYLDLRKYGNTNHGGFKVDFDKLVKYIVGVENVADIIPYPRFMDDLAY